MPEILKTLSFGLTELIDRIQSHSGTIFVKPDVALCAKGVGGVGGHKMNDYTTVTDHTPSKKLHTY